MAEVKASAKSIATQPTAEQKYKFTNIGRAWRDVSGKGNEVLRISIDRKFACEDPELDGKPIESITLRAGDRLVLAKNNKRVKNAAGESVKDADFRLSIVEKIA